MAEQAVQTYEEHPVIDFNPNDHLIQIPSSKGKTDYLPVQWRLVWFRLLCPQGTIDTEELEVDNDRECEAEVSAWNQETRRSEKVVKRAPGYARYRAVVTDGKGGRASATKTERKVDFDDFVEKAETGAVGRALAMLGYGTQFAMIEFDEGERIVDAPVERKPAKSYQERRPFVEADTPKDQALHALTASGSYEQHEAERSHHDLPTIKELQARCNRIIGSGMWQTWLHKALKIEDDELVLQDDDLTPNDRERIAASLDYAEQAKAQKKASAGAGR